MSGWQTEREAGLNSSSQLTARSPSFPPPCDMKLGLSEGDLPSDSSSGMSEQTVSCTLKL